MPYYDMKCRLCGGYVGQQFFEEENISVADPRMIGPGLCGHHDVLEPAPLLVMFTPVRGKIGTSVTLPNRGIDTAVFFNGIAADNPRIENGSLVVDVPSGASTGDLEITPPGMQTGPLDIFTVEK